MTTQVDSRFLNRVTSLPMVSAAVQQAMVQYQRTKAYNGLLSATLTAVEAGVGIAAERAAPFYKTVEAPLITVDSLASSGLGRLEEKYPAIKMTPDEFQSAGYNYYEGSLLKTGVDKVLATTQYGKNRVEAVRGGCVGLVTGVSERSRAEVARLYQTGLTTIHSSLDLCDDLVDRYVAEEDGKASIHDDDPTTAVLTRVGLLLGRTGDGVRVKTNRRVRITKRLVSNYINTLQSYLDLATWRNAASYSALSHSLDTSLVRNHLADIWTRFDKVAAEYNVQPEALLLRAIRSCAGGMAALSGLTVQHGATFVPDTWRARLESGDAFWKKLSDQCAKSERVSELGEVALAEAKELAGYTERTIAQIIDRLSSTWTVSPPAEGDLGDEELLPMSRAERHVDSNS